MTEYRVTEKQLEKLSLYLEELSGVHKDMMGDDGCVNLRDLEDARGKLNEIIQELKYFVEDIEGQEVEDKANISDIVQAGKSIQAIANDIAQKMGMCDLPEGVKFKPKGEKIIKEVVF